MHFTCRTRRLAMRFGKLGILHHWALEKLNSMGSWCTELSDYMGGWCRRKLNSMGGWVKKKCLLPPQVFLSGIALMKSYLLVFLATNAK